MANEAETASAAKRTSPLRGGDVISTVEGLAWPAIPDQRRLLALNVLYQMERSERWPAERVRRYQFRQLRLLLRHAAQHVPFYRERFRQSGFDPEARITPESWRQIPLLTRSDIQENFAALQSEALPKAHVVIDATRMRTDNSPIEKVGAFYILQKREGKWKIAAFSGVRTPA